MRGENPERLGGEKATGDLGRTFLVKDIDGRQTAGEEGVSQW